MSKKWPGGIITPTPATPTGPYEDGRAPGIWTLSQQSYWAKQGLWPTAGNAAPVGLFGGGSGPLSSIDYFNIISTGNATFFGNLTQARIATSAFGSTTRSVWASGGVSGTATNTIDYVTPTSTGNATSFGQLNFTSNDSNGGGCNSSTRGLAGGGYPGVASTSIDYVTIASTGNATAFGELSVTSVKFVGCCSSPTRGVWVGGANSGGTAQSVMQYVTIATTGSTLNFGYLTSVGEGAIAASNSTRAIVYKNTAIEYFTIATTGNAASFGTCSATYYGQSGCASSTIAVAKQAYGNSNVLNYVTISTTGNATLFGYLATARSLPGAVSSGNGGTQ